MGAVQPMPGTIAMSKKFESLKVGRRPTTNVDMPIKNMVIRKVYLRPMRSPSRPNTSAPNGRTRKPAA